MADGRSKVGCIDKSWLKHGEALLSQDVSLDTALQVADRVFVVTSQAGFDALLRGKDVWCFGAPFYAGWGLTHDFVAVKR
ncbi:hypothetical protein, partial [Vibrio alginolyticus]|uniref:capsular polysaccharide export protein, LipB/KpsS family n=1 Tax=Vibrio alginolyticus TaxID=663 RepID=UPI00301D9095